MVKQKTRSIPKRVKDCRHWQDMAGDTPLEQMLNAYLTDHFILTFDIPADECLSEAKKIIAIVNAYGESCDPGAAWDELGREKFK